MVPDLSEASIRKFIRWDVRIIIYHYECIRLSTVDDSWPDLLSQWTFTCTISRIICITPLSSAFAQDFEWQSASSIAAEHSKYGKSENVQVKYGLLILQTGQIWIPQEATDLQITLFVIAHTSTGCHRGQSATVWTLASRFQWKTLEAESKLIRYELHSLSLYHRRWTNSTTVCSGFFRQKTEWTTPIRLLGSGQTYHYGSIRAHGVRWA